METAENKNRFEKVPQALRDRDQWITWRKGAQKADGRFEKEPTDPRTGYGRSATDPDNWTTFERAVAVVGKPGRDGISFVPAEGGGLTLVDFDKCLNERGEITKPWVVEWLKSANTYAERSPSGKGIRVAVFGAVPRSINNPDMDVEMYSKGQQLTITGDHLEWTPDEVREAQGPLTELFKEYERKGGHQDLTIDESEPPVRLSEYALSVWRGERPKRKADGQADRSGTLFKICCELAKVGATAKAIRSAAAERDAALGFRKYLDRPNERAEREYARLAVRAIAEVGDGASSPSLPLYTGDREDGLCGGAREPLRVVRFTDMPPVPDKRRYVVRDVIPARYPSMLYAAGGSAKSLLAASLLQAVGRGDEDWMGFQIEEPGPGLYVDFELDWTEQTRRMRHLALGHDPRNPDGPEDVHYLCSAGYPVRKVLETAYGWCGENQAKLLVLDSMGYALEGDAEAMKDVMAFFRNYIKPFEAIGATVLIVDHQSKLQSGDNYHAKTPFGSVYKSNSIRSAVQVEPGDRDRDEHGNGTLTVRLLK